jgi:transposase
LAGAPSPVTFHFTPTSGSWLNAVETFFSALTRHRLKRGSFASVVDFQSRKTRRLRRQINRYIAEHNDELKPFSWIKTPGQILAKLNLLMRGCNGPVCWSALKLA